MTDAFIDVGYFTPRHEANYNRYYWGGYDGLLLLRLLFPQVTAFGPVGSDLTKLDDVGTEIFAFDSTDVADVIREFGIRVNGGQRLYTRRERKKHPKLEHLGWNPLDSMLAERARAPETGFLLTDDFYGRLDEDLNGLAIGLFMVGQMEAMGQELRSLGDTLGLHQLQKSDDELLNEFRSVIAEGRCPFVNEAQGWGNISEKDVVTADIYRAWVLLQNFIGDMFQFEERSQVTLHAVDAKAGNVLARALGCKPAGFDGQYSVRESVAVQELMDQLKQARASEASAKRRIRLEDYRAFLRDDYGSEFREWLHITLADSQDVPDARIRSHIRSKLEALTKQRRRMRNVLASTLGVFPLAAQSVVSDFDVSSIKKVFSSILEMGPEAIPTVVGPVVWKASTYAVRWLEENYNPGSLDRWHAWLCSHVG